MVNAEKKIFIIISADEAERNLIESHVKKHVNSPVIYLAEDGVDGLRKANNVPPHVVITDIDIPKMSSEKLVDSVLANPKLEHTSIIIVGDLPEHVRHEDEIVTGRVQFFHEDISEKSTFTQAIMKALNFAFHDKDATFSVRFLARGEVLLKEGEKGTSVFIVKKGQLRAFRVVDNQHQILGNVEEGEFVGEMAIINGEPRMANVDALTDCELIEIPMGTFEKVLYSRPSWSKGMMKTLSKRLKRVSQSRWARSENKR
ncbi:MAG: cyclic nucleotide-binding domain-containing protein [Bacteriovoracia bacterium]